LFYILQYPHRVFAGRQGLGDHVLAIFNLPDGGLVFYGGVIVAAVAYVTFCLKNKIHPLELGDAIVPSLFIGLAFGRLGCFLNGCCYGDRSTLPWAVTFPKGSVPYNALLNRGFLDASALGSLPLHPTQIYASINAAIIALLTFVYFRYRPYRGSVVALALIVYPITRSTIELLRGDEMGQFGTQFTIAQWVSAGIFVCGVALWAWCYRQRARGGRTAAARPASSSA
jgi:phosphatidylglycerol:prolipoprotein diacylglycerol transferase